MDRNTEIREKGLMSSFEFYDLWKKLRISLDCRWLASSHLRYDSGLGLGLKFNPKPKPKMQKQSIWREEREVDKILIKALGVGLKLID